eukprot:scaffold73_cov337-Pavlova_lutheri.AAC.65
MTAPFRNRNIASRSSCARANRPTAPLPTLGVSSHRILSSSPRHLRSCAACMVAMAASSLVKSPCDAQTVASERASRRNTKASGTACRRTRHCHAAKAPAAKLAAAAADAMADADAQLRREVHLVVSERCGGDVSEDHPTTQRCGSRWMECSGPIAATRAVDMEDGPACRLLPLVY